MGRTDTATGFPVFVRAFHLHLLAAGLQPRTIANYLRDVEALASRFPGRTPASITPADLTAYFVALQEGRAPKTVREAQLAARRFYRFLQREGEVEQDPTREVPLTRFQVNPQPLYSEAEVKRLLLACGARTRESLRNRALVMILLDTGVRVGELVSMGLPDWERRRARVRGKTGVRDVPLGMAAVEALERYARRWGVTESPLWRGKKGRLTESGVAQTVRRLCRRAGVTHKGVHAFRRTAAAQMKRSGMNDSDILEVLGWKNITMLRRYTAEVAGELAQAAHRRHSPGDRLAGKP